VNLNFLIRNSIISLCSKASHSVPPATVEISLLGESVYRISSFRPVPVHAQLAFFSARES